MCERFENKTMKQKKLQLTANQLGWLFCAVYMFSYLTRINFGAVVSEMELQTGISKSMLSMSLTGCFITYGIGQIISGICGDRLSPKKLITGGLAVTVVMNLILPLWENPWYMLAVWCVNGFAQAFMWPPMVKLMSETMSPEQYRWAAVRVSWGSSIGTIVIYLVAPLLITLLGWKWVFLFSAACGILGLGLWRVLAPDEKGSIPACGKVAPVPVKHFFAPCMLGVMLAIILQGMLRDGVTTWMPSFVAETYHFGNAVSIMTGVLLPVFSIVSFRLSAALHKRLIKNPVLCAGVIFAVGTASAAALFLLADHSAAGAILLAALLTAAMHGVNLMLVTMIPPYFQKYGGTSTASGILNACTYIGSALSAYGIAVLSERCGWNMTILIWAGVAAVGTLLCLLCAGAWKKRFQ